LNAAGFVIWVILAFIIASAAKSRRRSYLGFLLLSLFLSPVVGFIVLLLSGKKFSKIYIEPNKREINERRYEPRRNRDDDMEIRINMGSTDKKESLYPHEGYVKWRKGEKILQLVDTYVVVDIETTGLETFSDEIIELSAIKIKDDQIIDQYTTLCKPKRKIDPFITQLTGITNEMLNSAPQIKDVIKDYVTFIGDSIVVGHNINFDINFIYYNYYNICKEHFVNNHMDTLRLARIALPNLEHHRLKDLIDYYSINIEQLHRGTNDCLATYQVYLKLKDAITKDNISLVRKRVRSKRTNSKNINLKEIKANVADELDETHPCYGKYFVFTGALEIKRVEAAQIVADLGGINENTVTKKTNYLVMGNYDYASSIKDEKSAKYKKAEEYILKGQDLQILTENIFLDMIQS
jgi:DNA polymerase-3 subunit epsilon